MTESEMQRLSTLIAEKIFDLGEKQAAKEPSRFYAVDEHGDKYEITEYEFISFQIDELEDIEREHVNKEEYTEALLIQKKNTNIKNQKKPIMKVTKEKLNVNSSAILTMSYDFEAKLLTVKFANSRVYQFENVTTEIFYAMKHSESIGKFFNKYIKWNYKFDHIG